MKSWLFTIMRNIFYNRIRKEKAGTPGRCGLRFGAAESVGHAGMVGARPGTGRCPRPAASAHREIIVLICVLGTPYDAAADICGREIGTIKSRLHRARTSLLVELGEDLSARCCRMSARRSTTAGHDGDEKQALARFRAGSADPPQPTGGSARSRVTQSSHDRSDFGFHILELICRTLQNVEVKDRAPQHSERNFLFAPALLHADGHSLDVPRFGELRVVSGPSDDFVLHLTDLPAPLIKLQPSRAASHPSNLACL